MSGSRCEAHVEVRPPLEQHPPHVRQPSQKYVGSRKITYRQLYRRQNPFCFSSLPSALRPISKIALTVLMRSRLRVLDDSTVTGCLILIGEQRGKYSCWMFVGIPFVFEFTMRR